MPKVCRTPIFRPKRFPLGVPAAALLLVGLLLIGACGEGQTLPAGRVALDPESAEVARNIQANLKEFLITNKVPNTAKVELKWVKKSPYEGLYEASFTIERGGTVGRRSFFFDRPAKHFVFGPVYTVGEIKRRRVEMRNMALLDRAAKGPEGAPVVIAEYSDFECPFCGAASRTINGLLRKYKDDLRLVFKHMPLAELHPWSYDAALTAECAASQEPETFWYFHDYYFDPVHRLTADNFKDKTLAFGKTIGLDVEKLSACVEKKEPKAKIDYDLGEAMNYGFSSTPTFVINGVVVVGNQEFSVFEEIIQEELRKGGKLGG